jgi:hypothetical protein
MNRGRTTSHAAATRTAIHRSLATRLPLAALALALLCGPAEAGPSYNFVESGSDNVLATLELSSLPATHSEVVGLEFSTEGEAIFGVLGLYSGTFDSTNDAFIGDGADGLAGSGAGTSSTIFDFDPAIVDAVRLELTAHGNVGSDVLFADFGPDSSPIGVSGDWTAVPEPSTLILFVVGAVLAGSGVVRRRRRDGR